MSLRCRSNGSICQLKKLLMLLILVLVCFCEGCSCAQAPLEGQKGVDFEYNSLNLLD